MALEEDDASAKMYLGIEHSLCSSIEAVFYDSLTSRYVLLCDALVILKKFGFRHHPDGTKSIPLCLHLALSIHLSGRT